MTNTHIIKTITAGALVLALFSATSALAYRAEHKAGKNYLQAGAYSQAIEQFEKALQSSRLKGKTRARVEKDLQRAKVQAAGEQYKLGERLNARNELVGALNAYKKAAEYDPGNATYGAKYKAARSNFDAILAKAQAIRRRAAQSLDWDRGLSDFKALARYEAAVPDLALALSAFKQDAAAYYTKQSDEALALQQYAPAYDRILRAASFSRDPKTQNRKAARHHLLLSKRAWERKQYDTAYQDIQKGLSFEPDNAALQDYERRFTGQWLAMLYNDAVQAQNDGDLALAKQRLTTLSRYRPGYLDTEQMLSDLNQSVSSSYFERANQLLEQNERENVGKALAYYMLVAEQQSSLYPDIRDRIGSTKKALRKELEYRISLNIKNSSSESGAVGKVRDTVLASLKGAKLKNIKVLERDAIDDILREQGMGQAFFDESTAVQVKKIKGIQAGVYVDVVKVEVRESGRERPSYGSVNYKSGTRFVPNPRYSSLQQSVGVAQQDVLRAQRELNNAQAKQNQSTSQSQSMGGQAGALMQLGSLFSTAGAQSTLRQAQKRLNHAQQSLAGEQPQIEEDVFTDWRYEIFNLELRGEVMLSYKIVNFTTSEISESQSIKIDDLAQDKYVPGDPGKGVASDPNDLPNQEQFKDQLLQRAMQALIDRLESELGGSANHFYQVAQAAAADDLQDDAVENYMRFVYSAASLRDPRVHEANDYIYDKLGLQLLRRRR